MSVGTPTARKPLRKGRPSLTTKATYPKALKVNQFPANTTRQTRSYRGAQTMGGQAINAAKINQPNRPIKRRVVKFEPARMQVRGHVSTFANKPFYHGQSNVPRHLKPVSNSFRKFALQRAFAMLEGGTGVAGLAVAAANSVYNQIKYETSLQDVPAPSWLGTVRRKYGTGWEYGDAREAGYPTPYADWNACPSQLYGTKGNSWVYVPDTRTSFTVLYKWWYYWPYIYSDVYQKTSTVVTGTPNGEWPFGQQEVTTETVAPRYEASPTPFPSGPDGFPVYQKTIAEPVPQQRKDPAQPKGGGNTAPQGYDIVIDISSGITKVGYVPTGSLGRSPNERKSTSRSAYHAIASLLGVASEINDFLEILYENFNVPEGSSEYEAFLHILDNWDQVDWVKFSTDLALNQIEDKIIGKYFFGGIDRAHRKLSGGRGFQFGAFLATL